MIEIIFLSLWVSIFWPRSLTQGSAFIARACGHYLFVLWSFFLEKVTTKVIRIVQCNTSPAENTHRLRPLEILVIRCVMLIDANQQIMMSDKYKKRNIPRFFSTVACLSLLLKWPNTCNNILSSACTVKSKAVFICLFYDNALSLLHNNRLQ